MCVKEDLNEHELLLLICRWRSVHEGQCFTGGRGLMKGAVGGAKGMFNAAECQ